MDMNAWDDIVRVDVRNVLRNLASPVNDTETARPWPPIMIRDFLHADDVRTHNVDASATLADVADCLAESPAASVAVYDGDNNFLGIAVDEDVMALIKRDGIRALDYPITEAIQRNRPVCSITDSPYVILKLMRAKGWDRIGVAERGRVIGILHRRKLVAFVGG